MPYIPLANNHHFCFAGLNGSSRILLNRHTIGQVGAGFALEPCCGFLFFLFINQSQTIYIYYETNRKYNYTVRPTFLLRKSRQAAPRVRNPIRNVGLSAHRTLRKLRNSPKCSFQRNKSYIAAAGMAAHLPGCYQASMTTLPVIGVLIKSGMEDSMPCSPSCKCLRNSRSDGESTQPSTQLFSPPDLPAMTKTVASESRKIQNRLTKKSLMPTNSHR